MKKLISVSFFCQNFTELGGPNLAVYKSTPGSLPDIGNLIDPLKRIEVDVVVIDPSISSEDRNALLREASMRVVEIPSCIESIQGARTYSALLDNLIDTLRKYKEKGAPG